MLSVNGLDVYHGYVHALKNVSLNVRQGELLAVLGANGAGKSTLLGTLAGLYKPAAGEIIFQNKKIAGQSPEKIVRAGIALIPEKREIFSGLSVMDNLMMGAFHRYRQDKADIPNDVEEVLELFPLLQGREKDLAGSLSGGLQQMLAIGRALMARPSLLLLDEPSIGLAPLVVREIMAILVGMKESGVTVVLVEQNTKAALRVADSVLVMERGKIVHHGSSKEAISDSLLQEAYLGRTRM
ncbi:MULTISPECIES: ABC transporter ATP-binding protein [Dehalobacter]|uniref:ATP-binding cassette domain-containing protein n=2 Tax=Dehalobacter restrictus TaxID=55583 RepID=A0A857DGS2_9FIRM|nr:MULTISPECIES: ABC transporter ATP-binding protein [Dehalobacter]AHF09193.1 metal-dependent hydrolase [Dehalobacter restrictus DSM 9455]MCG1025805.1 ABC transporter ATP-binding protein [Dehalobacter sp.]MDJ0306467.1 ABC transporter ATP-binding protein [Dehalobacter sp.]OCZ51302.1 branched-chain amino acid ABC transporter ATP-binding protein [Dehalobacter sp. TeCB1]QGZ99728.1 ATP-binding cassette domain-containing protein [Dehalobacter restrictus]